MSRICIDIDAVVEEFLTRPLDTTWYPYVFLDATYVDVRSNGHVTSKAVVVATGVSAQGRRVILGMDIGDSESTYFWTEFLRSLRERGLKVATDTDPLGVQVVTSDAHSGIKNAVKAVLSGASWQRCRLHFARNVTQTLGSARSKPVNALIATIFAQTTPDAVKECYHQVISSLSASFPQVARMLTDAESDLTAFATQPRPHWQKICTTQPHRASQPRDQTPYRRRPGLPRRRLRHPPHRSRLARPGRGMAIRGTPLPLRDLHPRAHRPTHPPHHTRHHTPHHRLKPPPTSQNETTDNYTTTKDLISPG